MKAVAPIQRAFMFSHIRQGRISAEKCFLPSFGRLRQAAMTHSARSSLGVCDEHPQKYGVKTWPASHDFIFVRSSYDSMPNRVDKCLWVPQN